MLWRRRIVFLFLYLLFKTVCSRKPMRFNLSDCIPGEEWTENYCTNCRCLKTGVAECKKDKDIPNSKCRTFQYVDVLFGLLVQSVSERCHVFNSPRSKKSKIICVTSSYQEAMEGNPCRPNDMYIYDSCTWCDCIDGTTKCIGLSCAHLEGHCNIGVISSEDCHKCFCSKTLFNICKPDPTCGKPKPGRCPAKSKLKMKEMSSCIFNLDQECDYDSHCTGNKKCCLFGCYLRCVNPIP